MVKLTINLTMVNSLYFHVCFSFFFLYKPISLLFLFGSIFFSFFFFTHREQKTERKNLKLKATMELRFVSQFVFSILVIALLFSLNLTNAIDHNESRWFKLLQLCFMRFIKFSLFSYFDFLDFVIRMWMCLCYVDSVVDGEEKLQMQSLKNSSMAERLVFVTFFFCYYVAITIFGICCDGWNLERTRGINLFTTVRLELSEWDSFFS